MQYKPKFRFLGDIFSTSYVVKDVLGNVKTISGRFSGLLDVAILMWQKRRRIAMEADGSGLDFR